MKKLIVLFLFSVFLAGCGEEQTNSKKAEEEIKVYTTVYPLQYFAQQIGGDQVNVQSILPPGSDPHTYEPTTKEMIELAEADLFIYNGAGLESYAEQMSDSLKDEEVKIVEASAGIDLQHHVHEAEEMEGTVEEGHEHSENEAVESNEGHDHSEEGHEHSDSGTEESHDGHDHGAQDPHVWLDPMQSIQLAENIKEALMELNPEQKSMYEENFTELKEKLTALDQKYHKTLENLPQKKIIVSHAAYGYWEKAYGIEQIAISGLSPSNVPSQKELEAIVQTAEKNNLNYVFFEQNVTPKVADVIKNEIGAEILRIHNLSVLTEEDLENNADYFSLMEQNLETLETALSN